MLPAVNYTRVTYYARRYAESNMISTVSIVRKTDPAFNALTGEVVSSPPLAVYDGKARIWTVSGPVQYNFGDEPTFFSSAFVSIPAVTAEDPMVDDLVLVVTHPGDSAMVGRVFQVKDVEAGGQWMSSRRLQVQGVQESKQWLWPTVIQGFVAEATASGGSGGMVVS